MHIMLGVVFLIAATTTVGAYARGRGGKPWLWGGIALGGYLFLWLFVPYFHPSGLGSDWEWIGMILPWAWIGLVAIYARFGLAAGRGGPSGRWSCPNCKFLNYKYAVVCEACKQPWDRALA
jgi:hypothetical protein